MSSASWHKAALRGNAPLQVAFGAKAHVSDKWIVP